MELAHLQDPFPLLTLPDLVLQHILTHLTPKERKATRATCKKLCKVASAAVRYFHISSTREDSYHDYLDLHDKFPNVQVASLADELVSSDRPFAALVTLSLSKLKNLSCLVLLNKSMALSAAGMAALTQCKHIKQLLLAAPVVSKGPLMSANTQAMAAVISQLPSLTHLLLLPSQQPDPAAAGPVAAALAAAAAVGGGLGAVQQGLRPRDWQLTEGAVRSLHSLHGLLQLEIGCDPVGLTDLSSLTPLSNLKHLALRGLGLEAGEQLSVLLGLPLLRSLSLDGDISEDSLASVGRCTKLTRLELQGCHRLREHSLSHLGSLHQLSTFKCSFALSETGLSLLISAAGPRLRMLHADCIEVVPADHHGPQQHAPGPGAAPGAASALAGPAAGAGGLAGGLAGSSGSGSGGGFGQLGPQLPALQVLQLRRITSVSPQLWQLAPSLTSLVVWGEASNTGLIRAFTGHCSLIHLALSCEHTSDAGLAALSGLSHLQDLTLCEGVAISAQRLIGVIQRLPRLKALQLSHMKHLNDDSLAALVTSAQNIRVLGLQEPGRVSDQGFALLAGLPRLLSLWVDCCNLSTAVLVALACSPQMALLEVHRSHPEAPGLGQQQLQLLGRVKGPRLEVVLREGHRPREELMKPQGASVVGGGLVAGGWGFGEGVLLGNSADVVLEPGDLRVMGSGMMLGAGVGDDGQLGAEWVPDWLPDLGGLHI